MSLKARRFFKFKISFMLSNHIQQFLQKYFSNKISRFCLVGARHAVPLLVFASLLWFGILWLKFLYTPLNVAEQKPLNFVFVQGATVKGLAQQLHALKVLKNPTFFVVLARVSGNARELQAGEYQITSQTTPAQLLKKMVHGEVIKHVLTIVEGWTFQQIKTSLANNQFLIHDLSKLDNAVIMQKLGLVGEEPEGRFAPDTYVFSGVTSEVVVLRSAYRLMQKRLADEWQNHAANAVFHCPYEALIAASIIEKESAVKSECPLIAGIILRRLQIGMPLQMDPTVIYGLGQKYAGKLTPADLKMDTAYNTYTRKGLPITPIAMPSQDAIHAALHPVIGAALYYVAKGDGSHVFSNTLEEHNKAVEKYLLGGK